MIENNHLIATVFATSDMDTTEQNRDHPSAKLDNFELHSRKYNWRRQPEEADIKVIGIIAIAWL